MLLCRCMDFIFHLLALFLACFVPIHSKIVLKNRPGPEVIKLLFMLSSAETKIYPADKC